MGSFWEPKLVADVLDEVVFEVDLFARWVVDSVRGLSSAPILHGGQLPLSPFPPFPRLRPRLHPPLDPINPLQLLRQPLILRNGAAGAVGALHAVRGRVELLSLPLAHPRRFRPLARSGGPQPFSVSGPSRREPGIGRPPLHGGVCGYPRSGRHRAVLVLFSAN